MKSKYWAGLLAALLILSLVLTFAIFSAGAASRAEISSHGEVIRIVDLSINQEFTVTTDAGGKNTVTVQDGKIAVTAANCPDGYCMARGYCHGGTQIVCLPNRLVIRFLGSQEVDGVSG